MSNLDIENLLAVKHEDTLHDMGYRNGETELKLEERDLDPSLAENRVVTSSKRLHVGRKFTKELADAMTARALELGVVDRPLEFPIAKYEKPDFIDWNYVNQEFSNPYLSDNHGVFFVSIQDGIAIFSQNNEVNQKMSDAIDLCEDKQLWAHLQAGYCAYIHVSDYEARWLSVPAYYASKKYYWSVHEYKEIVKQWEKLKSSIRKAATFQTALDQHYYFKKLPFAWSAGVKQVMRDLTHKGLANGESHRTVIHLVLDEDFSEGRFERVKGDYLCTPKIGKPNWTSSDYEHEIKVGGSRVKTISHEITCKTCLTKMESLIKAQEL